MEFIKRNITVDPETNCWNWNKSTSSAGYGQFTRNRKYWTTHRYVYTMVFGDIPKGLVVRHLCHNTKCCNPEHLSIGTQKDNWYDSEDTHRKEGYKYSKWCIINGINYRTIREANKDTGISMCSLIKYTDKSTRVFDTIAYREACKIARCSPKV